MIYRGGSTSVTVTLYKEDLRERNNTVRKFPDSTHPPAAMNEHRPIVELHLQSPPVVDPEASHQSSLVTRNTPPTVIVFDC